MATVSSKGTVTAKKKGTATITATAGSHSAACTVTVTQPPESYPVRISKQSVKLFITDNNKAPSVSLSVSKPKSLKKFVWCSDDPEIAEVTQKGKVIGRKNGIANIYCQSVTGEVISAPCVVYVNQFTIDTTDLLAQESCSYVGGVYCLNYSASADLGIIDNDLSPDISATPVTWKSSSAAVISIDASGLLTCKGRKGTVTITASRGKGLSTSVKIRAYMPTESLTLLPDNTAIYVGKTVTIKPVLTKNADEPVLWLSTNAVATVTEEGVVKGISQGEARIIAYTKSGFTQEADVTVRTRATGFTWDTVHEGLRPNSTVKFNLDVGESKELFVRITAPEGSNDTITWSTSKKDIVAITGLLDGSRGVRVLGLKKGAATITAKTGSGKKVTYLVTVVPEGAQTITLSKNAASIYVGGTTGLSAKVLPKGCNDVVIWKSANPAIATVDENGKVYAVSQGDTTITAYSTVSGVTDVASVRVMTKVTGFTWDTLYEGLNPRSTVKHNLGVGGSKELYVRITAPEGSNDIITWSTSRKDIVAITDILNDNKGARVIGLKKGAATITAKTGSGRKVTYLVTVVPEGAESITLSKNAASVYVGGTVGLSAKVLPKGCNDVVIWKSANPAIATVDENGKVYAVSQGDTTITAYSTISGVTDVASVRVMTKAKVFKWDTIPEGMTPRSIVKYAMAVGDSKTLRVRIIEPEGSNDTVVWTNSNKKAVEMITDPADNKSVEVRGLANGTAKITARTGSGKTVSYQITVLTPNGNTILLNKHEATMYKGSALTLAATVSPRTACVVMWRSSDPDVAVVDENGKITALANGTATITAYFGCESENQDSAVVTVVTKATSVTTSVGSVSIAVGESINVSAFTAPEGCGDSVRWTSNKTSIATVAAADGGSTGIITGVRAGTCTVQVRTGSGKYRNITVKVHN